MQVRQNCSSSSNILSALASQAASQTQIKTVLRAAAHTNCFLAGNFLGSQLSKRGSEHGRQTTYYLGNPVSNEAYDTPGCSFYCKHHFMENTTTPLFFLELSKILVFYLHTSYLQLLFYTFSHFFTISGQKS